MPGHDCQRLEVKKERVKNGTEAKMTGKVTGTRRIRETYSCEENKRGVTTRVPVSQDKERRMSRIG
jgi:hypothetical protein